MMRSTFALLATLWLGACSSADATPEPAAGQSAAASPGDSVRADSVAARATGADKGPRTELPPNEMGRIPILEYHLIGEQEGHWTVSPQRFRENLELLWQRGYRPVTMAEVVDRSFQLPAGISPVVIVFDDASPSQFRYLERGGELKIDPTSALGIWESFKSSHAGWDNKAVFCVLSGAEAGRSFFGDKGIEGQKSEWRHRKVKYLADQGFEICNHTLWHATLSKYPAAVVQEQIARLQLAVDSAVPGYRIRTFALPLGVWPKDRALAQSGSWTDPKTGKTVKYHHDAILRVAGGPAPGPNDPQFDPLFLTRIEVFARELEKVLDQLDKSGSRYVSDGNAAQVAKPDGR